MINSVNKVLINSNKIKFNNNNNSLYNSISKTLLNSNSNINNINNINNISNSISGGSKNDQLVRYYSSKNFKDFSNYRQQRKYYEEQYKQQQREREYYKKQSKEQEYQFHEQQQQQQQFQSPSITIFRIIFKILGSILFGWLKRTLNVTEYKELYRFTKDIVHHQRNLIEESLELPFQRSSFSLEPKVVSTQFIPRHSLLMNQEDQVMMVCELPINPALGGASAHVVTLAKSLPDRVESKTSFFFFQTYETVKCADPIRVTLLIDSEAVGPFGFIQSEKREVLLYSNEEYSRDDGFGGYEYDIFEGQRDEDDENDQYYQEKHQYHNNTNSRSNSKNKSNVGDTIVLDPKDFHEVTNKKK